MSDVVLYARAIEANEQVTRAFRALAEATEGTVEAFNRLVATIGPDGIATMRAYERRWRRYQRTAHPGQPRRPYRHGRVGVR